MNDDTPSFPSAELAAIGEALAQSVPFNALPEEKLVDLVSKIEISYHSEGEQFLPGLENSGLRILRSGAVELKDSAGQLIDRLGEGESFHIEGLNARHDGVVGTAIEDTLIYLLPDKHYQALRNSDRDFDRHFHSQRNRRLRRAARYEPVPNLMTQAVGSVMSKGLMTAQLNDSVQSVAQKMTERRVSSVFVMDGEDLVGLVTDRDLRERLIAEGLSYETPVAEVMTPNPLSLDSGESLFNATLFMTQKRVHHLPVLKDGKLAGMVTTSDLMLARQDDPVYLVQHISRQNTVEGMQALVATLPRLVTQWAKAGMRPQQIGRVITAISDGVTVRLLKLGEEQFGPPPVPYCWLGFGSQGRGEQMLGADQDNGIIIDDSVQPNDMAWYARQAKWVCDGLNACGWVYCPGEIMAMTPKWCQPLSAWREYVDNWTSIPTTDAVMRVTIFFDLRGIYGEPSLVKRLQTHMLKRTSSNSIFLAALAANAMATPAPLGIFRRFVVERGGEQRDQLNLKKRGVMPITDIARLHALAHGVLQVNTDERLRALIDAGHMRMHDSRNLTDALHYIQRLRLNHQVELSEAGEKVTNYLNPRALPKLAKEQLRDAFTVIDEAQTAVRLKYRAGMG
ncbi:MAG: nucleotidyltransferase [Gammaproteobacteria bacterium]|nr:MAG: nucleotidyltransferase [Gammaproteobacteria bacterium]